MARVFTAKGFALDCAKSMYKNFIASLKRRQCEATRDISFSGIKSFVKVDL